MFETDYYYDIEKIDCYLSDLCSTTKKNRRIGVEISLPFISISASGEFSKDISTLPPRQKLMLLQTLLEKAAAGYINELTEDYSRLIGNTFIYLRGKIAVPEMVDMIKCVAELSKGALYDFMKAQLEEKTTAASAVLSLLAEHNLPVPITIDAPVKCISRLNADNIVGCDELDFWDEVSDECEIFAKIQKVYCPTRSIQVMDIGKSFGLSRAVRRSIPNYENNSNYNIIEDSVALSIEILSIKK